MTTAETRGRVFAIRMWSALLGTQETLVTYLGIKLGLYRALADHGPANPAQLAHRAGIAPRYAREWLEHQAVAGVLTVEDPTKPADERVFELPPEHARILLDTGDLPFSGAAVLPLGAVAAALPRLLSAYRTGEGVPDEAFGDDWREGHAAANRGLFGTQLPRWLAELTPDLHEELARPGRRALDVACGAGWAAISLAQTYPDLAVDGLDIDAPSIERARRNAEEAGVADRVRFTVADAADPASAGGYDLVCLFDALHELPRPVETLRACRASRGDDGTVLVLDARVAPEFTAPGDEVERFQYCTSLLHCLPAALSTSTEGGGAGGSGTVLRAGVVNEMAREAGYAMATPLPVDDRFHTLYRLVG